MGLEECLKESLCRWPYPCKALVSRGNCLVSLSRRREAGVSPSEIIPLGLRLFRICVPGLVGHT